MPALYFSGKQWVLFTVLLIAIWACTHQTYLRTGVLRCSTMALNTAWKQPGMTSRMKTTIFLGTRMRNPGLRRLHTMSSGRGSWPEQHSACMQSALQSVPGLTCLVPDMLGPRQAWVRVRVNPSTTHLLTPSMECTQIRAQLRAPMPKAPQQLQRHLLQESNQVPRTARPPTPQTARAVACQTLQWCACHLRRLWRCTQQRRPRQPLRHAALTRRRCNVRRWAGFPAWEARGTWVGCSLRACLYVHTCARMRMSICALGSGCVLAVRA